MAEKYYLPSSKSVGACKLFLAERAHLYSYTPDHLGRTLIRCSHAIFKSDELKGLERAAVVLNEGYGVQVFLEKELQPYGLTRTGKLWVQHKKGHDHYTFDFSNYLWCASNCISVEWLPSNRDVTTQRKLFIAKIILVGEGNAVRNARRWIHHQLINGKTVFDLDDMDTIARRIAQYKTSALFVVNNGYVIDVATATVIDRYSKPPALVETTLLERTYFTAASACAIGDYISPMEKAFNQAVNN